METVVYSVEGKPLSYPYLAEHSCQVCHQHWYAVSYAPLDEVECPYCGSVSALDPGMRVEVVKQLTIPELTVMLQALGSDGDSIPQALIDLLSRQATLTCAITAPLTWWMQLPAHDIAWYADFGPPPYQLSDFAVPLSLDQVDELNETAGDPILSRGSVPLSMYVTGLATFSYRQLDDLARMYRYHPEYEWQKFLQLIKPQVELPELAPALSELDEVEL